ncbi:MAG: hypothetical protein ACRD0P_23215, partial [Stackebrandtia sp.]
MPDTRAVPHNLETAKPRPKPEKPEGNPTPSVPEEDKNALYGCPTAKEIMDAAARVQQLAIDKSG